MVTTYLTPEQARKLLTDLKPGSTIEVRKLPTGEIAVSENAPTRTKEDILKEKYACLIGQPITVSDAADKYDVPRRNIIEWARKDYIPILKEGGRGSRMELDEAEVAYCAGIYLRRKNTGVGFRAPLLDENGLEYQLKHPGLSRYRRRKKADD